MTSEDGSERDQELEQPSARRRRTADGSERDQKMGMLVLVATPIGNLGDLSPRAVAALQHADVIAAEDTRRTRALLTHSGIPAAGRLRAVHEHNERAAAAKIVEEVRQGRRVVYVTDAGTPAISDPGEHLVHACIEAGLPVELVPGPSAALHALVLSGLPTERFVFEGFLPRKGAERAARLAALATDSRTTVLFEAPSRLGATLADLRRVCGPERRAAIARELTKTFEEVVRGTLDELVERAAEVTPRGEHVIVVGPASPMLVTDEEIAAAAVAAVSGGASARDAADVVARSLGISRRRAYEAVLNARQEAEG